MSLVGRYEVSNELKERREIQASMRAARAEAPRSRGTLDYENDFDITVLFLEKIKFFSAIALKIEVLLDFTTQPLL